MRENCHFPFEREREPSAYDREKIVLDSTILELPSPIAHTSFAAVAMPRRSDSEAALPIEAEPSEYVLERSESDR